MFFVTYRFVLEFLISSMVPFYLLFLHYLIFISLNHCYVCIKTKVFLHFFFILHWFKNHFKSIPQTLASTVMYQNGHGLQWTEVKLTSRVAQQVVVVIKTSTLSWHKAKGNECIWNCRYYCIINHQSYRVVLLFDHCVWYGKTSSVIYSYISAIHIY